jgi:hypothetical protein
VWKDYKPHGHWKDIRNQRAFFDQLAIKLNIKKPEDWYVVKTQTVLDEGGNFIISYYNSTLILGTNQHYNANFLALQKIYPEHNWIIRDRKPPKPRGHWKDIRNQRAIFDQLAVKLNIKKPEDWYKINVKTIMDLGGGFVSWCYNGSTTKGTEMLYDIVATESPIQSPVESPKWNLSLIYLALQSIYPEHRWLFNENRTFSHTKSQIFLLHTLRRLLPKAAILSNYRFPKEDIRITNGLKHYEFDVSMTRHDLLITTQYISSWLLCCL